MSGQSGPGSARAGYNSRKAKDSMQMDLQLKGKNDKGSQLNNFMDDQADTAR